MSVARRKRGSLAGAEKMRMRRSVVPASAGAVVTVVLASATSMGPAFEQRRVQDGRADDQPPDEVEAEEHRRGRAQRTVGAGPRLVQALEHVDVEDVDKQQADPVERGAWEKVAPCRGAVGESERQHEP